MHLNARKQDHLVRLSVPQENVQVGNRSVKLSEVEEVFFAKQKLQDSFLVDQLWPEPANSVALLLGVREVHCTLLS